MTPEKRAALQQMYTAGLLQRQHALDVAAGTSSPGLVFGTAEQELQHLEQMLQDGRSLLPVLSEAVLAARSRQQHRDPSA